MLYEVITRIDVCLVKHRIVTEVRGVGDPFVDVVEHRDIFVFERSVGIDGEHLRHLRRRRTLEALIPPSAKQRAACERILKLCRGAVGILRLVDPLYDVGTGVAHVAVAVVAEGVGFKPEHRFTEVYM